MAPPPKKGLVGNESDLLNQMIEKLDSMNTKMTNMEEKMTNMQEKLNDVLEENTQLKKQSQTREREIREMDKRINFLEQRSRINNLEISNFPQTANEDLIEVVKTVGKTLQVEIKTEDIQVVHRVPRYNKQLTNNIVVNFCSRWKKMELVNAAKAFTKDKKRCIKSKDINKNLTDSDIYVSDHLTPYNKKLLNKTKIMAKEKGWRFVWYSSVTHFI